MSEAAIVFGGLFVSLALVWLALGPANTQRKRVWARARRVGRGAARGRAGETRFDLRRVDPDAAGALNSLAKRWLPNVGQLQLRLRRTGRTISVGNYAAASAAVAAAAFTACAALGLALAVGLAFAVAAGAGLPHMATGLMIHRRRAQFAAHFPDAVDLMVRGLKSGLPITETVAACAREIPDPVGQEFRGVADAVRAGQPLEDALWNAADRIATAEFRFFVVALTVQRETGGNLAETLSNLSSILRARKQMRLKVTAMASEAKASSMILGGLPFLMFGVIYALNPDYVTPLFTDPRGRIMLAFGVGIMAAGVAVMRKMTRFEI